LQNIAKEMNLSETAFILEKSEKENYRTGQISVLEIANFLSNTINDEVISISRKNGLYPRHVNTMPSHCKKCASQCMVHSHDRINNGN